MKCPICGKDLDLQNKQIGTSENGDPIFNASGRRGAERGPNIL